MQFRVTEGHYTRDGIYLAPGTVIGDGCDVTFDEWRANGPTADMVPLDTQAQKVFADTWQLDQDGRPMRSPHGPGFVRR